MNIQRRGLQAIASQLSRSISAHHHITPLFSVSALTTLNAIPPNASSPLSVRWESTGAVASNYSKNTSSYKRKEGLLVDTLDMMHRFEDIGMTREQAEALTQSITEVLCANRDILAETYVSKTSLEKSQLEAQASTAGFRAEVLKSQELQVATFTRDTERLQSVLDKVRSEIRYEIDKLTASQRLDLNLEKGRMRDELQMLRDKTNELDIKVDKEVNSLKAAMEQSKNDTVKYVLGMIFALLTAGLGAARLFI